MSMRKSLPSRKKQTQYTATEKADKMAALRDVVVFSLLLGHILIIRAETDPSSSPDGFDSVLGDSSSCHGTCQLTYPLHTSPQAEELYACQRGCRLFSICQFVDDANNLNQTKLECESACLEAYSHPDEQYACNLGCQNQLPFAEMRREQLLSLRPKIHLLYPLTLVRSIWSDMMGSAHGFITSSWTFYLQADDDKIVVFQSRPEVQYVPQMSLDSTDLNDSPVHKKCDLLPDGTRNGRSWLQGTRDFEEEGEDSFLKCLSTTFRNSGWILSTTLVLSVVVLLWICCATVATAVDQYVPTEKLSIYGDMEYMKEHKLNLYPPASLVLVRSKEEEIEEAGPLPTKVDLAHSAI
ncbi:transmembrane protein 59 [Ambystoma mexicanum]|uniref:transmembrane protein 59 n=1 Tax=Ambystoma mexicanum TaxID=8296 RepID=UPI0037E974B7